MAEREPLTDRFLRLAQHLALLETHGWDIGGMQRQVDTAKAHAASGDLDQADTLSSTLSDTAERILRERAPFLFITPSTAPSVVELPAPTLTAAEAVPGPEVTAAPASTPAPDEWMSGSEYLVIVDDGSSRMRSALSQAHAKSEPALPTASAAAALPVEGPATAPVLTDVAVELAADLTPDAQAEPELTATADDDTAVTLAVARAPVPKVVPGSADTAAADLGRGFVSAALVCAATDAALATLRPEVEMLVSARLAAHVAALPPADAGMSADALDRELDWRLERVAAERGWCSLADVETVVRRLTGGDQAASVNFARLESALLGFVQQTQEQQTWLLSHLRPVHAQSHDEQPTASATSALTSKLSRSRVVIPNASSSATSDASVPDATAADDEAAPAELLSITPLTDSLDAVPTGVNTSRQAAVLNTQTAITERSAPAHSTDPDLVASAPESAAVDEVATATNDLEQTAPLDDLDPVEAGLAAVLQEQAVTAADQDATPAPAPRSSLDSPIEPLSPRDEVAQSGMRMAVNANASVALPASELNPMLTAAELDAMLAAALGEESAPAASAVPVCAALAIADSGSHAALTPTALTPTFGTRMAALSSTEPPEVLRDALRSALPELLADAFNDPEVRQQILGIVAAEMVTNPGVLGEITGIRSFLQRELAHAAMNLQPAAHGN